MIEIERKFLVTSNAYKDVATSYEPIKQGFLNTDPERTVRIRVTGDFAYLTVKGISNTEGTTRFEWEQEITVDDAQELFQICEEGIIEKIRYKIPLGNHILEVDEFCGENEGLTIAEIELQNENDSFERPDWLGKEVTGDIRYYNSNLSKQPYKTWK